MLLQLSKDALDKAGCPSKVRPGRLAFNPDNKVMVASKEGNEHEMSESLKR